MDPVKILKRAWQIVWNYRTLWIFAFILAMVASNSPGNNSGNQSRYTISDNEEFNTPADMQQGFDEAGEAFKELFGVEGRAALERSWGLEQGDLTTMFWVAVAFIVAMFLLNLLMAAVRYVAETSVIRMVDEYEASGEKLTFREGWRLGWNRRAWNLFLINLIVNLPVFLLLAFFVAMGFVVYSMATAPGAGSGGSWAGFAGVIAVVLVVLFVFALLMAFLNLLRHFFWRKAALEELDVRDSLKAGYELFRENWKDIGIMWLVMVGVGIGWAIASIVLVVFSLPLVAITLVAAGGLLQSLPGGIPALDCRRDFCPADFLRRWLCPMDPLAGHVVDLCLHCVDIGLPRVTCLA